MGNASSIKPQAEIQDLKSNNVEKPEDVKSSPTAKCPDSCVITTEHTKLITAQGNTSKATAAKAPEILPSKAPSSPQKQVTVNAPQGNTSKATDAKAPEILPSKAPYLSQKQVNVNAPQGNIPKVSDPKAPEVLPSTVASSSQKQDLPSKAPLLAPPDDKTLKNSAEAAETATFSLQSVPDENKKGLSKLTTRFSSSLDRFWTSAKNFKARLTNRKWSTVSANRLDRVESEGGLSTDSRIESSMFLNQHKLDGILAGYKKKLSVLLVFPKASKQYKVFCEAIEKTNFIQPSQATDSRGSVSYCKENIFDLIIIDATNEKLLDAKDLCRKLRAHNPGTIIIAVRQRNYFPWPWESSNERLSSFIAAGFNRDFLETHSVTACQDALACFEKDVDSMIQLRLLKALFLALENVQETIEISNASHELQYVNKAFENHMGYSVEEAKGKHWYELMVSDRNPMDQPMKIKQQLDSSNQWEGFNYIKKKTGEQVTNTCHIIPLIEAGKVLQFIGIRKMLDSKLPEVKVNIIDSPSSGSNQSGWPAVALSDAHTGSRRISSAAMRERMMSITATQSPHSFFSNQNLMTEVTAALANIKSHQCPQAVYQIIDRVIEIIRSGDRSTKAGSIFKEDDELITELLDGLMTSSIPTNVEEDLRGRRRSTYYPMSKSISRMATRHSDAGSITIATLPLAAAMQSSAGEIRRVLDSVFTWNFNVIRLEELTNKRPLLYVGLKVFQTFEVYSFLSTDAATFKNWLDVIEQNYNSYNPYHNSTHAADVLQAAASLCRREKLAEMFDDLDVVSTLIAAAIHDLDHPGKTNSFLINSGHKLAILYNDVSVLENHHTALAFRLTFKDNTVNIFQKVEKDDYRILRQQIIDMVLATDMTKHFDYLGRFNDTLRRPSVDLLPGNLGARVYPVEFRTVVKRMLIKCCDVSNPTRPIESCKIWAERIAEEYCRQTDEEKALGLQVVMPVFDRAKCNIPKTQLSFMNLFILSMMESWNEFCPVPDLMRNLESNFDYWQQMEPTTKEKVVRVVTN